ncbi:MAG: S8 family serine peptidase [Candidatus Bipolaricaulota bacterium]|nr:S8 family serine peptidase [Candidatus Bipolaricaulota bacterium]MDW8151987.1 S8 family serine peptidase [Candidatus Bipolaricaulota bacterium]
MRLALLLILWAFLALASPQKLDPFLRALLQAPPELGPALLAPYAAEPDPFIPVFLELQSEAVWWEIPGARSLFGRVATATLPLSQLPRVAEHPGVLRVWASRPLEPLLDRSVPEIGAPTLWHGSPRTTGQGVVVGLVDSGVDILHPAFRVDRDGDGFLEGTRILFYWDQTAAGGGGFPPFWGDEVGEGLYGRVYAQQDLEAALRGAFSPAPDTLGHGTHVAGIAAGGFGAGLPGVAPGADLVVVKTNFYEDSVLDGIRFVLEAAAFLGRPGVVNLSLGGHTGSHDGRSALERSVDLLAQRPGAVIVCAAGNEGQSRIHVGGEVRTPTTWTLVPNAASVVVRFWYDDPARFAVSVRAPTGETLTVTPGQSRSAPTAAGLVWLDHTLSPLAQEPRQVFLTLSGASRDSRWRITFEPLFPGRVDGWVESAKMGYFLEGNGERAIAEPGNAPHVITVGAYVTRVAWAAQAGEQRAEGYTLWALAPFSSRGPTRDGRLKPDLAAPGAWIASALSSAASPSSWYVLPDGKHLVLAGTSMAAPHVAGACALLLSLRPDLTREELLQALRAGARADAQVGAVPNTAWGWGKLDLPGAWAAVGPRERPAAPWLAALDNPARASATFRYGCPENTAWAELHVYDLLGRLLWREALSPAGGLVRWDLRTAQGHAVASGLYLAVLVTDRGRSPPVRVVVQR